MNKASLQRLPKKTLIELIQTYARNWLTLDGLWFTSVEDRFGTDAAVELDLQIWKKQAAIEAKRLLKLFRPVGKSPQDVLNIIDGMTFSNVFSFEVEKVNSRQAIFFYPHCAMQEARVKQGRGEFSCKEVTRVSIGICAEIINPEMRVRSIFCPPDDHPDDCWCKWEVYLPFATLEQRPD